MDLTDIARLFTRPDGSYAFARWARPIAPIVFGVEDQTLPTIKGAVEAIVMLANHKMTDHDPELGANLLMFFIRDWDELTDIPDLDRLVPDLVSLVARLKNADAHQYRLFSFDGDDAIKAAFVFLRMDEALRNTPAEDLALAQAAQIILLWSDQAFADRGPLGLVGDTVILAPDIASVIHAAYDPVLPPVSTDPSHAIRLAARVAQSPKT
ncbi:MAG: hypothetical protein N2B03_01200 [Boseongicola sp.]